MSAYLRLLLELRRDRRMRTLGYLVFAGPSFSSTKAVISRPTFYIHCTHKVAEQQVSKLLDRFELSHKSGPEFSI